jgi:PhnB protein
MLMAKGIPEGYQRVVPYLAVADARKAIEFYKRAFGATERSMLLGPAGMIAHCELQVGDSVVMLADPLPQFVPRPPTEVGATTIGLFTYVEDVDEAIETAAEAGATITMAPEDQFWGDRFGQVRDPFGHMWQLATRIEDLTPEEVERRGQEFMAGMSQG